MDLEDVQAVGERGEVDEDASWEAAEDGVVEVEGAVGGDHEEGGGAGGEGEVGPFAQELVDDFSVGGARAAGAAGAEDGVGFVEEDDAGGEARCEGEYGLGRRGGVSMG